MHEVARLKQPECNEKKSYKIYLCRVRCETRCLAAMFARQEADRNTKRTSVSLQCPELVTFTCIITKGDDIVHRVIAALFEEVKGSRQRR